MRRGRTGIGASLAMRLLPHADARTAPASSGSTWSAIAASCHSLSFDEIGGTIRRLRHGSPEQVIADIRGLYRAGGPAFPPELSPGARGRPGDANQIRAAVQFARARAGTAERGERAIRAIFSGPSGTCFECHDVVAPPPGTLNYRIRPIQFTRSANGAETGRYIDHGWFDHRAHQIVQRPGERRQEGSAACLSCHTGAQTSQSLDRPAAAGSAELPRLPWRRAAPACRCLRPAPCATIITWTGACPPSCFASARAGSGGNRPWRGRQPPSAAGRGRS